MSPIATESARNALPGPAEAPVSLWDGLRGLSFALDLVMGRRRGHAQTVAALGVRVGQHFGLSQTELSEIAIAALLKDVGCPGTRAAFTNIVGIMAGAMAALDPPTLSAGVSVSEVILTGLLHDLGKLAVPTTVLDKNGPLTPEEWADMRRHPADSAWVIRAIAPWQEIALWAGAHHERPDGKGYHQGLAGDAIPPIGRLLAAADAFDAMIADRPYRNGLPTEEAIRRIREERGKQFDPIAADLLEAVITHPESTALDSLAWETFLYPGLEQSSQPE